MTRYEQTLQMESRSTPRGIHVAPRSVASMTRSKVLVMPSAPVATRVGPRRLALGRKGRRVSLHRRALDGAFLTFAMATAALIWWSAH